MSQKAACCLLLCAAYHLLFNLRNTCVGSSVFFKELGQPEVVFTMAAGEQIQSLSWMPHLW